MELRALKRPWRRRWRLTCVLSIGDFGVVALFGNDEFPHAAVYLYPADQLLPRKARGRRGNTRLILLTTSAFTLFTLARNYRARHATKLIDITALPSFADAFTLAVERGEQVAVLANWRGEKHVVEFNCRFLAPASSGTLPIAGESYARRLTPSVSMLFPGE